ncbi:DUF1493 family protein [Gibbsiella dentisursi]|uniref:DUF1493 family protein n=1 Tax=Gibbsiella dentisursi TaxID=796890 RepID=UPI0031FA383A
MTRSVTIFFADWAGIIHSLPAVDNYYYYPWKSKPLFPRKQPNEDKKPLTIIMYIESANAGHWLYD